tara:strand:- start:2858 stop:3055 length:198 start_codon:yes stop_codon:yes gene_type:complete
MKQTHFFISGRPEEREELRVLYVRSDIGKIIHKKINEPGLLKIVGIEINENSFDVGLIVEEAENG